jgi:hypothetical protein
MKVQSDLQRNEIVKAAGLVIVIIKNRPELYNLELLFTVSRQ